jgi:hypothetical protein
MGITACRSQKPISPGSPGCQEIRSPGYGIRSGREGGHPKQPPGEEGDDLDYTVSLAPPLNVKETATGEVVLDLYVYTESGGLHCILDARLERGSRRIRVYDPFSKKEVFV